MTDSIKSWLESLKPQMVGAIKQDLMSSGDLEELAEINAGLAFDAILPVLESALGQVTSISRASAILSGPSSEPLFRLITPKKVPTEWSDDASLRLLEDIKKDRNAKRIVRPKEVSE